MKILNFVPNSIKKNSLSTDFKEIFDEAFHLFLKKPESFIHIKNQGPYSFWYFRKGPSIEAVFILEKSKPFPLGVLSFKKDPIVGRCIELSMIAPLFQGKGLGLKLYASSLDYFGVLKSATDLSKASSALWKSLLSKFQGHLMLNLKGKYRPQSIVDWELVNGYTFPILDFPEGRMSLRVMLKSEDSVYRNAAQTSFYLIRK
jgi:hypothetical protein